MRLRIIDVSGIDSEFWVVNVEIGDPEHLQDILVNTQYFAVEMKED